MQQAPVVYRAGLEKLCAGRVDVLHCEWADGNGGETSRIQRRAEDCASSKTNVCRFFLARCNKACSAFYGPLPAAFLPGCMAAARSPRRRHAPRWIPSAAGTVWPFLFRAPAGTSSAVVPAASVPFHAGTGTRAARRGRFQPVASWGAAAALQSPASIGYDAAPGTSAHARPHGGIGTAFSRAAAAGAQHHAAGDASA